MASPSAVIDLCVKVEKGTGKQNDIDQLVAYVVSGSSTPNIRLRAVGALLTYLLAQNAKGSKTK